MTLNLEPRHRGSDFLPVYSRSWETPSYFVRRPSGIRIDGAREDEDNGFRILVRTRWT